MKSLFSIFILLLGSNFSAMQASRIKDGIKQRNFSKVQTSIKKLYCTSAQKAALIDLAQYHVKKTAKEIGFLKNFASKRQLAVGLISLACSANGLVSLPGEMRSPQNNRSILSFSARTAGFGLIALDQLYKVYTSQAAHDHVKTAQAIQALVESISTKG